MSQEAIASKPRCHCRQLRFAGHHLKLSANRFVGLQIAPRLALKLLLGRTQNHIHRYPLVVQVPGCNKSIATVVAAASENHHRDPVAFFDGELTEVVTDKISNVTSRSLH